jgi:hypothetical protein
MDHNNLLAQVGHKMPDITGSGIQPGTDGGVSKLESIISKGIGLLTFIAVIFFVVQIILAGYAFISSQGDEKKLETARTRLTSGVLGLTIVILALGLGALVSKLLGLNNVFSLSSVINTLTF